MELKRKVAMVAATLAVALGAGHLMQNSLGDAAGQVAMDEASPKAITPLAAGIGAEIEPVTVKPETAAPVLPETAFSPALQDHVSDGSVEQGGPVEQAVVPETSETTAPDMAATFDSTNCAIKLDVMAGGLATLDLTLIAPCRKSERVMLHHGGLTVTAMTSSTGALFTSLPGMDSKGEVSVYFNDGVEVSGAEPLPDLSLYRRFAVQWVADDNFQLHAFENGAGYGEEGHVSAANPQRRLPNVPVDGGYLTLLGDSTAPLPMLAEVYTYPLDFAEPVILTIEAAVTEATCDRELLGDVLFSEGGTFTITDLTMVTPTCDAVGDVLVLNNPLPDLKLAAAN